MKRLPKDEAETADRAYMDSLMARAYPTPSYDVAAGHRPAAKGLPWHPSEVLRAIGEDGMILSTLLPLLLRKFAMERTQRLCAIASLLRDRDFAAHTRRLRRCMADYRRRLGRIIPPHARDFERFIDEYFQRQVNGQAPQMYNAIDLSARRLGLSDTRREMAILLCWALLLLHYASEYEREVDAELAAKLGRPAATYVNTEIEEMTATLRRWARDGHMQVEVTEAMNTGMKITYNTIIRMVRDKAMATIIDTK